jgi:hypothetical protein
MLTECSKLGTNSHGTKKANVDNENLEVIQNTLNQDAAIRNEQADTLVKLAQVKSILGNC